MKKVLMAAVTGILVAGAAVAGEHPGDRSEHPGHQGEKAREKKITLQTTCPVMGGKINKDLYVDHAGKRVYMCCKGCIEALKKDPQKYIKKLEDQGVTVAKVQTTCPVMGGKVNKDLYVDHDGKRIYLCCAGCAGPVKKDPEMHIGKLEKKGIVLDLVPEKKSKHEDEHKHGGRQ